MSDSPAASDSARIAIILAAGMGTRMRSGRSKVLHEVGGRSSLQWVIDASLACGCSRLVVVIGPEGEEIREQFGERVQTAGGEAALTWVTQEQRLGTGHALQVAARSLTEQADLASGAASCTALVLYADAPLVRPETLERLLHSAESGFGALSTAVLEQPGSLGRVRCTDAGQLLSIVEVADATAEDLDVRRVNAGHYALQFPGMVSFLDALEPANEQGEYYLTDAVVDAAKTQPVQCIDLTDASEAWGINDREDLSRVHEEFCRRTVRRLQRNGVTVLRPETVTVEASVVVETDVVLHPGVTLLGGTRVGSGTDVHVGSWLRDASIGRNCEVRPYSVVDQSSLADGCGVGPFARLRGGAELGEGVHVGNFVEVKKSRLEKGVKAAHLAYLGDAEVGEASNIGAGVVTCNYDGQNKHQTKIGKRAFVGSDSMLVAPVTVGDGATTAAGSVVTHDVPEGALAVGRARQRNIEGWAERAAKKRGARSDR